jgi:hypothetical protein
MAITAPPKVATRVPQSTLTTRFTVHLTRQCYAKRARTCRRVSRAAAVFLRTCMVRTTGRLTFSDRKRSFLMAKILGLSACYLCEGGRP